MEMPRRLVPNRGIVGGEGVPPAYAFVFPPMEGNCNVSAKPRPAELLLLRNTRPVNVWGLPAISVPCGKTKAGLPIGFQIIGAANRDTEVLQLAYTYEQFRNSR